MNTISNSDDVIDSREIIARIAELENLVPQEDINNLVKSDDATELVALREFAKEMSGYCTDWKYGVTLVRDSYFQAYAQELADDIGAIPENVAWPCTCIDWDQAARELQMDYTSGEFDGVTYWGR